jgi:hypothetical protein
MSKQLETISVQEQSVRWNKRIVGHSQEDPRTLIPHPDNPRQHNEEEKAIFRERVRQQGELDEIKVAYASRRIINGHMRREIAIEDGEPQVWVTWLDLKPEEELEALFFYDQLSKMAIWDTDKTLEALGRMPQMEAHSEAFLAQLEQEMKNLSASVSEDDEEEDDLLDDLLDSEEDDEGFASLGATGKGNKGGNFFKVFLGESDYDEVLLLLKRLGKTNGMKDGQNLMIFAPQ